MPRNRGTSRKGKPKKEMRSAGFGKALERCVLLSGCVFYCISCGRRAKPAWTKCHHRTIGNEKERADEECIYFSLWSENSWRILLCGSDVLSIDTWSTINFAYRCGRKNEGGMKSLYSLNHMNIWEWCITSLWFWRFVPLQYVQCWYVAAADMNWLWRKPFSVFLLICGLFCHMEV